MLVSPAGTLTCPGSEVTSSCPAKSPAPHLPFWTSLPLAAHWAVAVPSLSGEYIGPCSQSQGHRLLSTALSRTDCLAQRAPGLVDQRSSHRLGKGEWVIRKEDRGSAVRMRHWGQGSGAQRVASAPPGQDQRTARQLGARSAWAGVGVRGPGQGTQGGQELTGQGHRNTTRSRAHSPGNEGQQRPQDAEVVDEEEEIVGRL